MNKISEIERKVDILTRGTEQYSCSLYMSTPAGEL